MRKQKHHRRPRVLGGSNETRNISLVTGFKHRAWHTLFHVMTPYEIADEINKVWLDPDFKFIVKPS